MDPITLNKTILSYTSGSQSVTELYQFVTNLLKSIPITYGNTSRLSEETMHYQVLSLLSTEDAETYLGCIIENNGFKWIKHWIDEQYLRAAKNQFIYQDVHIRIDTDNHGKYFITLDYDRIKSTQPWLVSHIKTLPDTGIITVTMSMQLYAKDVDEVNMISDTEDTPVT